ncbi:hypothetical protein [Mailhella massiliensis]|uniref:hypothetical protein n=1 Tax=Mailhella massiliensis TaxID=1903261 RepID=UPI00097D3D4E|nr:hypothetical protein [Mailhella massiliensis]
MNNTSRQEEDKSYKEKNTSSKNTIYLIISLVIIACVCVFLPWKTHPTKTFDDIDNANFQKFKNTTQEELYIAIDQNIDNFIDDLTGLKSIYNAAKDLLHIGNNNKDQFIADIWDKHFNNQISSIIDDRVQILVSDLYTTNIECMNYMKAKGINVEGFDRKIKEDLENSIRANILLISSETIDNSIINQVISIGAGTAAGAALSKVLKTNFITTILSFGVDALVSCIVDEKLHNELKNDLKNDIKKSLDDTLSSDGGLFTRIKTNIDYFHITRSNYYEEELSKI